jgi:hypothetical protein
VERKIGPTGRNKSLIGHRSLIKTDEAIRKIIAGFTVSLIFQKESRCVIGTGVDYLQISSALDKKSTIVELEIYHYMNFFVWRKRVAHT